MHYEVIDHKCYFPGWLSGRGNLLPICLSKSPQVTLDNGCSDDTDCPTGAICVTYLGSVHHCEIACDSEADCRRMTCITTCPNGDYSPAGFCETPGLTTCQL